MENGQAESSAPETGLAGLVGFLSDKPEKESTDTEPLNTDEAPDEDNAGEENDESDDEPEGDEPDDDDEPAPVERKIKVPDRHEDGTVTEIEVTEKELIASYERQAAFTRKTTALAEREHQAVQFLQTKHEEVRNQYLEQAAFARSAVEQMAGFRTESEMAQLAHNDPAAWVAENQRQQQIRSFLGTLDGNIKRERDQAGEQSKAQQQRQYQQTIESSWAELAKEKIDRPALVKIYESTAKHFGFKPDEMSNITDHRVVKMMRDAAAFRELKARAPEVTRKAQDAPRMPAARQATPAQERQKQSLAKPFVGGRAKLNDLAAYLR